MTYKRSFILVFQVIDSPNQAVHSEKRVTASNFGGGVSSSDFAESFSSLLMNAIDHLSPVRKLSILINNSSSGFHFSKL